VFENIAVKCHVPRSVCRIGSQASARGLNRLGAILGKRPAAAFDKWLFLKAGQQGDYFRDPSMVPDLRALQANIDLQHKLGLVKATIDVPKHSDLSIVQQAARRVK